LDNQTSIATIKQDVGCCKRDSMRRKMICLDKHCYKNYYQFSKI